MKIFLIVFTLFLQFSVSAFADQSDYEKARALFASGVKPQIADLLKFYVGECYSPTGTQDMLMSGSQRGTSLLSQAVGIDFALVSLKYAMREKYYRVLLDASRGHTPPEQWAPIAIETESAFAFPGWQVKKTKNSDGKRALVLSNGKDTYCYALQER